MGDMDLGLSGGLGGRTSSSVLGSSFDRELSSLSTGLSTDPMLRSGRSNESSYQSKSYSSTTTQSSSDGGRPHYSSHSDSTHKSTRTGASGIPHTSYSHNTSSFDTDRPYKNNVSSFS